VPARAEDDEKLVVLPEPGRVRGRVGHPGPEGEGGDDAEHADD